MVDDGVLISEWAVLVYDAVGGTGFGRVGICTGLESAVWFGLHGGVEYRYNVYSVLTGSSVFGCLGSPLLPDSVCLTTGPAGALLRFGRVRYDAIGFGNAGLGWLCIAQRVFDVDILLRHT